MSTRLSGELKQTFFLVSFLYFIQDTGLCGVCVANKTSFLETEFCSLSQDKVRTERATMGLCESQEPKMDLLEPTHYYDGRPTLLKVLLLGDSGYNSSFTSAAPTKETNSFIQRRQNLLDWTVSLLAFVPPLQFVFPSLCRDIATRCLWRTIKPPSVQISQFRR